MGNPKDIPWNSVQHLLTEFAERIVVSDASVCFSAGSTANDTFLFRGYVSFRREAADHEVAVTVDAALQGGQIALTADACVEDGEVLAEGPKLTFPLSAMFVSGWTPLDEWIGQFERFLASIETAVKERVATFQA